MSNLMLYLLEASAALVVLYGLYALLLRSLTFFSLNRFFLLAILAFSLIIPLLSFDLTPSAERVVSKPVDELRDMRLAYYQALDEWMVEGRSPTLGAVDLPSHSAPTLDFRQWLFAFVLAIYAIGFVATISRTVWTYTWMHRLKNRHPHEVIDGVMVVKVPYPMAPFSFLNAVFVHKETLQDESFQQILAHEKTHIDQRHSIDLIFVQLTAAFLWFNPIVWQLIKSLKATHEYIVDKQMINRGYSLVEYQTLLLRQLISNNSYGLVHNFNLSFIKKRITMMKIKESGWAGKAKVATVFVAVSVFSLVIVQCNSRIDEQVSLENDLGSRSQFERELNVPVLSNADYNYYGDLSSAINLTISDDQIFIDGTKVQLNEMSSLLDKSNSDEVVVRIDRKQSMALVEDVQLELSKADKRKLIYIGQTAGGKEAQMTFLLAPDPSSELGAQFPTIDDAFIAETGIDVLEIPLWNASAGTRKLVYDFVFGHVKSKSSNYVISAKAKRDASYGDYLTNLHGIFEGFHQIYDERARAMFGKSWSEIYSMNPKLNPSSKVEYDAAREGIPMAVSLAWPD